MALLRLSCKHRHWDLITLSNLPRVRSAQVAEVESKISLLWVQNSCFLCHASASQCEPPVWKKRTLSQLLSWQVSARTPGVFSQDGESLQKVSQPSERINNRREERTLHFAKRSEPPCVCVYFPLRILQRSDPLCISPSKSFKSRLLQASYSQELSGRVNMKCL